jgi:2-keto-4-pentenoate hydratase/2-oxohepta-3-ene-1,7-dioic acid hydratase in catechol pathway
MKLATYFKDGVSRVGIVRERQIIDPGFAGTMIEAIANWQDLKPAFEAASRNEGIALASVALCAPVTRPGKIWAIGLNYADHVAESKMATPERQVWFTKAQTSINGPFEPVLIARNAPFVDYEVELVAVIGKRCKHVAAEAAQGVVFGYCVGNDVTERVWQHAGPQWSLGKSFDTHAPIGPWITMADEVDDPHALGIRCFVNGELRQSSNTQSLIFNIWRQIEHLSAAMTLEPGDIIFTGTPSGVGAALTPRQFLKPGDTVRCEIDSLGHIEAVMAAEA